MMTGGRVLNWPLILNQICFWFFIHEKVWCFLVASIKCIIRWRQSGRDMHTERLRAKTSPVNPWDRPAGVRRKYFLIDLMMAECQPALHHQARPGTPGLMSPSLIGWLECQLGGWSDWFVAENLPAFINILEERRGEERDWFTMMACC